jgi:hypothetical protein
MVVMNQSSLYVPTQHIIDVYEEIKQNKYTPPQRSFLFFTLASAQRLPLKGILSMPPRSKIKKLFSELQDKDRIWLIPALEKDNPTRHWTYSNYEQLQEESPERIMLAFFRMREYRYRIKNLRKVTSFDTHEGILAQLIHARDRRLNRYSIHAFLWENNRILERGGHRRRAHHPIERQEKSKTKRELTLTAKGEGTLRYTLSWRPPNMSSPVLGSFVKQHISKEGDKQFLNIEFDVPKKGIIWIHDQLPSPVQLLTFQASWIEEIQIQNQELFIKTKELTPGRHHIKIPIYTLHKGSYQDPPVRVGQGSSWFAQSESAQLIIK